MTRQQKHRNWRRQHGFCAYEGCNVLTTCYLCPEHRAQRNQYARNWYATRGRQLRESRKAVQA